MRCSLALLALVGALCACERRAPSEASGPPPAPERPAAVLSSQQVAERSEQCARDSSERFRKEAFRGIEDARGSVTFAQHYNTKLDTCFMLLTAVSPESPGDELGASPAFVVRKLIDVSDDDLYGEYLGGPVDAPPPDRAPDACEVMGRYCASGREWEVMIRFFMQG